MRLVELTSAGKAKIDAVRQEKKDNDKMMLAPLSAEERQRFFEILTKINNYYLHMEQELIREMNNTTKTTKQSAATLTDRRRNLIF